MMNEKGAVVCTSSGKFFVLTSFKQPGVLNIEAISTIDNLTITEFAEIVAGCFESRSSFRGVGWINFTYDNVTVHVTRGETLNYPTEYIVTKWKEACKLNKKKTSKKQ
jgi:hypothetical protein